MTDINQTDWNELDSSNNSTSPNGWAAGMLPSAVEPSARAMRGALKRFYNQIGPTVTSSGGANAQTLTYPQARTAYVNGDPYAFKAGFSNSGAMTMNVSGLGAKAVQRGGSALTGGEIVAGNIYELAYDGTQFQILGSSAAATTDTSNASNITSGTLPAARLPAPGSFNASVANPTGNAAVGTLKMMGLGSTFTLTPNSTGKALISIYGQIQTDTPGDGVQWHVRFGTGTAPVNGAATTGTPLSNTQSLVVPTAASQNFALSVVVTGLTLGVPVWFDIALMPTGGGTASITNVAGSGLES